MWKNSHISAPNWPILMIFLANMVNSCMLMDIMTTRKVHEWILGVKTLKNQWKPLGENYSTMPHVKNSHFSGPSWPILMILWSIHVCWWILWRPEVPMWPSWAGNLAWKKFSQNLLYAAYSIGYWGLEGPLNVNFLEFFYIFRIILSKGTRKCLWSKEKLKSCANEAP